MASTPFDLIHVIEGCKKRTNSSQRDLYEHFFGYGMNICLRFVRNKEEAIEVMNDGFLKIFLNIDKYDPTFPFKGWLRKILVNTAIDHYRKTKQSKAIIIALPHSLDVADGNDMIERLFPEGDLLPLIQNLPPTYQMVFNLYVMEGYKHKEISKLLGISEGTSKSNLSRAKEILRNKINPSSAHQSVTKGKVNDG